jgi:hypothetical protein
MRTKKEIRNKIAELTKESDEWAKGRDEYLRGGNEYDSEACAVAVKEIDDKIRILKWVLEE